MRTRLQTPAFQAQAVLEGCYMNSIVNYVWSSYLIVYGGFGLWVAYRYRKLRNTEDRVRALQERLRILRQEREPMSAKINSSTEKPTE